MHSILTGIATNQRGSATNQRGSATNQRGSATNQRGSATNQRGSATNQRGSATNQCGSATNQRQIDTVNYEAIVSRKRKWRFNISTATSVHHQKILKRDERTESCSENERGYFSKLVTNITPPHIPHYLQRLNSYFTGQDLQVHLPGTEITPKLLQSMLNIGKPIPDAWLTSCFRCHFKQFSEFSREIKLFIIKRGFSSASFKKHINCPKSFSEDKELHNLKWCDNFLIYLTSIINPKKTINSTIDSDHITPPITTNPQNPGNEYRYEKLIEENADALIFIPVEFRTKHLCLKACEYCGRALEFVPNSKKTPEILQKAIRQNYTALEFVPENMRTKEIVETVIKSISKKITESDSTDEAPKADRFIKSILNKLPVEHQTFEFFNKLIPELDQITFLIMMQHIPKEIPRDRLYETALFHIKFNTKDIASVTNTLFNCLIKEVEKIHEFISSKDKDLAKTVPEKQRSPEHLYNILQTSDEWIIPDEWLNACFLDDLKPLSSFSKSIKLFIIKKDFSLERFHQHISSYKSFEEHDGIHTIDWCDNFFTYLINLVSNNKKPFDIDKKSTHISFWIEKIPQRLRTQDLYDQLIKGAGQILAYIPEKFRTSNLYLKSCEYYGSLECVPYTQRTEAMCLAACKNNGDDLKHVPENMKTPIICEAAFKQNKYAIIYFPENTTDRSLWQKAANDDLRMLCRREIPENYRTTEFFEEMIPYMTQENFNDLMKYSHNIKDVNKSTLYKTGLIHNKCRLRDTPDSIRDADLCLTAIKYAVGLPEYIPDNVINNIPETVWQHLQHTSPHLSDTLRSYLLPTPSLEYERYRKNAVMTCPYISNQIKTSLRMSEPCQKMLRKSASLPDLLMVESDPNLQTAGSLPTLWLPHLDWFPIYMNFREIKSAQPKKKHDSYRVPDQGDRKGSPSVLISAILSDIR